jgi:L-ascorbate metabolism protein UlaG (beta-lactamase superfamily)
MARQLMLVGVLSFCAMAAAGENPLEAPPEPGEAHVWYLGHAGWLVRTSEHCLIFDATGPFDNGQLDHGSISPELLAGQNVIFFISHAHGDHFDPAVLTMSDSVENSAVVSGWRLSTPNTNDPVVPAAGRWTNVSGAQVFALHHDFDSIPEGFFLVRSGGVTIFHSGDHGTWADPPGAQFRSNIDRMAAAAGGVDMAFISSFGSRTSRNTINAGDLYTITELRPRVTLPMHCGGCEERYSEFAREVSALGLSTVLGAADGRGWYFHFRGDTFR